MINAAKYPLVRHLDHRYYRYDYYYQVSPPFVPINRVTRCNFRETLFDICMYMYTYTSLLTIAFLESTTRGTLVFRILLLLEPVKCFHVR